MRYRLAFRWFVYVVCLTSRTKGLFHVPSQMDSTSPQANLLNSSPKVHGNGDQLYSTWSQWTSCSVSCGVGISSRSRKCLKSTYNSRGVSIPLCHGEFAEHKVCKLKSCSVQVPSLLEIQCSQYNNRVIAGKFVKSWTPATGGSNPCELRCESKADQLVYSFGKVSNGTPCPLGACLDGRCLTLGCDDRLGSDVALDMCGVCGGRNSTCVHYKDVFQAQPSTISGSRSVYHEVVSIPVGARNLIIHQRLGKNLLALQDRSKGIIFNGEQTVNKYGGNYEIAGSKVEYLNASNSTEELLAKGPLTQELYVLVLLRAHNPGIYYEYWLPKQSHNQGNSQNPIQPNREPTTPTKPSYIPTKPQSYNVPIYEPRSAKSHHTNHHPTKPAFAYGFGDKPFKGQEPPVFRHILATTNAPPDNSWLKPLPYPESFKKDYNARKDIVPGYKPRYLKPETDYYQTFRNTSRDVMQNSPEYTKELPVQGDSSVPSEAHENVVLNVVHSDKKADKFDPKKSVSGIKIDKRGDSLPRKYISNGRLKYSFDSKNNGDVYVNSSAGIPPEQLAINVLTLPEDGKSKTSVKKIDLDEKPRPTRGGRCEPCQRKRNQTKHFCESDFVVRAQVMGYEFLNGETRYELEVIQSFKNTLSLLTKEYVWSPDTCRCPKLRQGKEYVLMGRSDNSYKKRESRLLVDKSSFVRTYNLKYARRLQKLRKDEPKKCKKTS